VIYRINRGDGAVRWLEAFGAPIVGEDGKPQKLAGVCMDITERRRGEEALREADRRKDAFLAMLGHELRNPLAVIASAASVLSTAAQTLVPSGRPLEIIRRQTELLHRLVGDLVDVTRISAGKIVVDMTPLDLAESADACVTTLISARRMDKHLVDLKGDHVWINGDGARVEQIITNLLTNAIKFTPDGGTITVRVEAVGGEALLRVKDDGMGIPPRVLPRVFDLFAQGDPPAGRRPEGLGVGLTLVRQLVELHGGRVEARSDGVGRGSEFVVRFPVLLATQPGSARAGGSPRATTP
jgi:signal transduction histidine kinase